MASFNNTRKRIYDIIDASNEEDKWSHGYDVFMIIVIAISMIPLMMKAQPLAMHIIDRVTVTIFIIDYLLRLLTADFKFERKSPTSFLRYPLSPMAIIDLLSILPSLIVLNPSLKALRLFRLARALRVFRIFKVIRYSKNLQRLKNVWASSKSSLAVVGGLALSYIFISALVIFPALSAMRVYRSFLSVTICSAVLSVVCALVGLLTAIVAGTPVGSTIVAVDIAAFLLFALIGKLKSRG